jgi:hypothetical protein
VIRLSPEAEAQVDRLTEITARWAGCGLPKTCWTRLNAPRSTFALRHRRACLPRVLTRALLSRGGCGSRRGVTGLPGVQSQPRRLSPSSSRRRIYPAICRQSISRPARGSRRDLRRERGGVVEAEHIQAQPLHAERKVRQPAGHGGKKNAELAHLTVSRPDRARHDRATRRSGMEWSTVARRKPSEADQRANRAGR